jgi:hypothetical protein
MKNSGIFFVSAMVVLIAVSSCRNSGSENKPASTSINSSVPEGLIPVGTDMITDVILRPDSLGDPWEVEKVKGFNANDMFSTLLNNIYNNKITVYSALSETPMKPAEVKKIVDEFGSDLKKIAKIQFCEDWFLDPATGNIVRKTKSIILGFEIPREQGLPPSYRAMFRIKP